MTFVVSAYKKNNSIKIVLAITLDVNNAISNISNKFVSQSPTHFNLLSVHIKPVQQLFRMIYLNCCLIAPIL